MINSYLIICILLILTAFIGTLMVAFSKENREGSGDYYRKGKSYGILTIFYIIATILLLFFFVFRYL